MYKKVREPTIWSVAPVLRIQECELVWHWFEKEIWRAYERLPEKLGTIGKLGLEEIDTWLTEDEVGFEDIKFYC